MAHPSPAFSSIVFFNNIGHILQGNEGVFIDIVNDTFQAAYLEMVDDEIQDLLALPGIASYGIDDGSAGLEVLSQGFGNFRCFSCDDHRALGAVEAFHDIVNGF